MSKNRRKRPFLGLHWKGFLWVSLLLLGLSSVYYALNHHYLVSQFRSQRQTEVEYLRRQINDILTRTIDRLIRLSGALASMTSLGEALHQATNSISTTHYANLGYELDIHRRELYTLDSDLIWRWAQPDDGTIPAALVQRSVEQVRSEERPVSLLFCRPDCLLYAFVPILAQGKNVGVMAIGQSIADFIIEFHMLTNTDLALIMPLRPDVERGVLQPWSARIAGITSADTMTPLLQDLARRFSGLANLNQGQMVNWNGANYDIHHIPLSEFMRELEGSILLVSDVSDRLNRIDEATHQDLMITTLALVVAELGLAFLIGLPFRRLERFADRLPLLATGAYQQARKCFLVRQSVLLRDEIDILYESAFTLSEQLEENSVAIEKKNLELAMERDFIQGLVTSAQVLVMTQTRYGVIRMANEFASRLAGYVPEQMYGRPFVDLIGDRKVHREILKRLEFLSAEGQKRLEHEQPAKLSQTVYWKDILLRAIGEKLLFFKFQPVVEASSGNIIYYEGLLRLKMADGRIATPVEFLSHGQRAGLSYDLDNFVIRTALNKLFTDPEICLSINLTPAVFADDSWTQPLIEAVRETGFNANRLIFEITETAVIVDMEKARQIAESITEHGFRFAVDDFGAGFSSLYYLKQLPISYVKLDRSLVSNISHDKGELNFVNAITTMVHASGKQVVAEGVEDFATLTILMEMGVDLLQGYYIGRPKIDFGGFRKMSVLQPTNSSAISVSKRQTP